MPKVSPIQTNFTAGEWSPLLEGRVDVARYNNAVLKLENFIIAPYGGVDRRPGSVFVSRAKFKNKKCRLMPFQFSTIQTYIIEMGDLYMRFYRDNGQVVEADKTISGATQADPVVVTATAHGYSNGDEIDISGVVGMTELNGKRFLVANVTTNTFELQDLDAVDVDGTGFTAYVSGGVANKIFEIVTPYLEAELFDIQIAQTADLMFIVHVDQKPQKLSRLSDTDWTLEDVVFKGGPFQPLNVDEAHTVTPSATTGSITVTASKDTWNANHVGSFFKIGGDVAGVQGYVSITAFNSATSVDADVKEDLDSVSATDNWAYGSFSVDAGFPQSVGFDQQRLWFGGTLDEPQTMFGSVILVFDDFTAGDLADDSLVYEIATEQVNSVRFVSSGRGLALGTSGGVFIMSSGSQFEAITPDNISVRRETNFGTELIIPKRIGNFLYYIQRGKRKMREFAYNFDIDSHRSLDMTLLSEAITESGIVEMDFQQSPNSVLWCIRTDGQLATMTRQLDQEVIGWCRQISGATGAGKSIYESVSVIPSTGENDQVWVVVKRTVNGVERRFVEFVNEPTFAAQSDAFFVDSGLSFSGAPTTILSGLDHLEGESVSILSEGAVHPNRTVVNGRITLSKSTTKAHVGMNYTSEIESMRIEAGGQQGTAQAKIKRITEMSVRFFKTLGGEAGIRGNTSIIKFRGTIDPMDTPPSLFTGDKRVPFPAGYNREGRFFIKTTQPVPMTVLAVMPLLDTFEF